MSRKLQKWCNVTLKVKLPVDCAFQLAHFVEPFFLVGLVDTPSRHAPSEVIAGVVFALSLIILLTGSGPAVGSDSNVLGNEFVSGEVIHEVLSRDIHVLAFVVLCTEVYDFSQLVGDYIGDSLEKLEDGLLFAGS